MNYIEVLFTLNLEFSDILMAELANLGYESFVENDEGLKAYIPESDFDPTALTGLMTKYAGQTAIAYQFSTLEKQNWNEEWERNYQPIEVADQVQVRASFHEPDPRFVYDILINPKMSFGTGHHETTAMMLEHQLDIDHTGKMVLDVGSGTGILAIMAIKRGAASALAFDIEEWAVENARENAEINNCPQITVFQGTIAEVDPDSRYNIILANINRNVLLAEIPAYTGLLQAGGCLLVSGFYENDSSDIEQKAMDAGLTISGKQTRNHWTSLRFIK